MRLVCLLVFAFLLVASGTKDATDKIDTKILSFYDTHDPQEEISFLAVLGAKADIATAVQGRSGEESGRIVFNELTKVATNTQGPLLDLLKTFGITHKSYWIVNMVQVQANETIMMLVAKHESVKEIIPNFQFKVPLEVPDMEADPKDSISAPDAIEWNINWVKAPQVWSRGIRGEGIVVANADTGVQWNHPALIQQYRGYGGPNNVSHNYNWWDAVHATGSSCGANSKVPCDDNGHGTHTTGTSVGDDHSTNQIGVAPRAKWIACRNMNAGLGSPQTYAECMQFFIAPTNLEGKNPNPDLRPHVIGNSWGCPTSEGCNAKTLLEMVTNVVAAGIFMSVSAGNSGSRCSTITDSPATYGNVLTVAASAYQTTAIASYSSRGPVISEGVNLLKPDVTAPGSTVRSSYPTNRYVSLSGTSMASPHYTGVIALLWQDRPELEREILATTKILLQTATPRNSVDCAGSVLNITARGDTRNNVYGHGELDCVAALISQ